MELSSPISRECYFMFALGLEIGKSYLCKMLKYCSTGSVDVLNGIAYSLYKLQYGLECFYSVSFFCNLLTLFLCGNLHVCMYMALRKTTLHLTASGVTLTISSLFFFHPFLFLLFLLFFSRFQFFLSILTHLYPLRIYSSFVCSYLLDFQCGNCCTIYDFYLPRSIQFLVASIDLFPFKGRRENLI